MEAGTKAPPEANPATNGKVPDDVELVIDAGGQMSMNVGGKKVTGSELRLVGGAVKVDGEFKKGDTVEFSGVVTISEVAFRDKSDAKTGQVVACTRAHKGTLTDLSVKAAA